MSADVWLVAIEKERSLPWISFYLGGSGARRFLFQNLASPLFGDEPIPTLGKGSYYFVDVKQAGVLLALLESEDALHADHEADEAMEFLGGLETFSFRDEYVLYVEIA